MGDVESLKIKGGGGGGGRRRRRRRLPRPGRQHGQEAGRGARQGRRDGGGMLQDVRRGWGLQVLDLAPRRGRQVGRCCREPISAEMAQK